MTSMTKAIKDKFKLALAQLNPVVGDIEGNAENAREARARAAVKGAEAARVAVEMANTLKAVTG